MGFQKGPNAKMSKKTFSKNQPIYVKSVEEYNFNLFYHNIYEYSLKNHLN
jgi:hypothetical protein